MTAQLHKMPENVLATYLCPSVSLLADVSSLFRRALAPASNNLVQPVCEEPSPDFHYDFQASRNNTGQ